MLFEDICIVVFDIRSLHDQMSSPINLLIIELK